MLWEQTGTYVRALGLVDAQVGILGNIGTNYFPGVAVANPLYRTTDGGRTCRVYIITTRRITSGDEFK